MTPGGAKRFPRGAKIFWTVSNSFRLCPTHFSRGAKNFPGRLRPLLVTGLVWTIEDTASVLTLSAIYVSSDFQCSFIAFVTWRRKTRANLVRITTRLFLMVYFIISSLKVFWFALTFHDDRWEWWGDAWVRTDEVDLQCATSYRSGEIAEVATELNYWLFSTVCHDLQVNTKAHLSF